MKTKELIRKLRKAGVSIIDRRGRGSHVLAIFGDRQATIPYHSADLGTIFCRELCKQLGLDPKEVL